MRYRRKRFSRVKRFVKKIRGYFRGKGRRIRRRRLLRSTNGINL